MTDLNERLALEAAVNSDHPCNSSSCDIELARDAGFTYTAAHLLSGATETPAVDAVIDSMGRNRFDRLANAEFDEWAEWYRTNTRACGSCGTHVHNDVATCGNCLADLPAAA